MDLGTEDTTTSMPLEKETSDTLLNEEKVGNFFHIYFFKHWEALLMQSC